MRAATESKVATTPSLVAPRGSQLRSSRKATEKRPIRLITEEGEDERIAARDAKATGVSEASALPQASPALPQAEKTVRVTDGRFVIKLKLDQTAKGRAEPILAALYPTFPTRTPISILIDNVPVPLRHVYEKAQHMNREPYPINFKVQQLIPPEPPQEALPEGELTLCELNSDLLTMKGPEDSESLTRYISAEGVKYPNIIIPLVHQTEKEKKTVLKQTTATALPHDGLLLRLFPWGSTLKRKRYETQGLNSLDIPLVKPSQQQEAAERPIKAFAWHRYKQIFAVARADDTINIYDLTTQQWSPICLKHEQQKGITSIEWQPLAGAVLAVGCGSGVLVWRVPLPSGRDSSGVSSFYALATEKHTATAALLQHSGHGPVTSIAWSPDGQFLASASPYNSSVIIWDRVLGVGTSLARWNGPGIHLVKWSPNGHYLFAATTSSLFLIFETKTWSVQKWNFSKPCQAAAWSADARFLLVSEAGESTIHAIRFGKEPPHIDAEYVRCEAVGPYQVTYPLAGDRRVGGPIKSLEWDRTGERLAVTFSGDQEGAEVIALFATSLQPFLQLTPRGFIRGPKDGKKPDIVAFANRFPRGALLTTCWRNGKISFCPLYFQPLNSVELRKW
jgi:hypothetical protein